MFLPIRDDNPHTVTPFVTYAMMAACTAVFVWQCSLSTEEIQNTVLSLGFKPLHFFENSPPAEDIPYVPSAVTIFTAMFLHGGWMHLAGNMLYLWIFGDNIEASLGHRRYLAFYAVCGASAALAQGFAAPTSDIPMIGASGAISGILGAYLVLHPRANVRVFVLLLAYISVINVPAFIVLGLWIAGQLLSSAAVDAGQPGVAFIAHVGGFFAGAILIFLFKKKNVPVFEPAHSRPFAVENRPIRIHRTAADPSSRNPHEP